MNKRWKWMRHSRRESGLCKQFQRIVYVCVYNSCSHRKCAFFWFNMHKNQHMFIGSHCTHSTHTHCVLIWVVLKLTRLPNQFAKFKLENANFIETCPRWMSWGFLRSYRRLKMTHEDLTFQCSSIVSGYYNVLFQFDATILNYQWISIANICIYMNKM